MRVLCHLFGIHRSVYYAQVKRPINVQRIELRSRVRAFHALSRGAVSSRAISQMLRQSDVDAGRWLARRLMREYGLTSRQPVKHHYRVNEDKSPPLPNLLNRQLNPAAPNRVWRGDISFICLQDKWCYLALVVDLYSRRIIGSALLLSWCVRLCVMHWKHDRMMAACCFIQIKVFSIKAINTESYSGVMG